MSHISIYNTYILFTILFKNQDKLSNKPFYQNFPTLTSTTLLQTLVLIVLLKTFCKLSNQDKLQNLSRKSSDPYSTILLQTLVLIILLKTFCKLSNQDKLQNLSIKTYFHLQYYCQHLA